VAYALLVSEEAIDLTTINVNPEGGRSMKSWQNVVALTFAGVLISGSAFAQATTPSGDQKVPDKSEQPKSTTDSEKSGAMKSDKSDMKSDMMKSDQRSARGGNREQVRAAQQALKDKGHDPGSVDGVIGPKTQAALKDFQKAQGIRESGRLDTETMSKLGVEGRSGAAGQSSPSASPGTTGSSSSDSGPKK